MIDLPARNGLRDCQTEIRFYNDVYRQTAGLVSRTLLFGWLQLALVL